MKINDIIVESQKDTHCSDKCCGADTKREDCKCPADCKHCNCNDPSVAETTTSGAIATSMGGGNGFATGIGTIQRRVTKKKKKKA
jgi:hypothetical protein